MQLLTLNHPKIYANMMLLLYFYRLMLDLKKEQRLEYISKVTAMANDIGYTVSSNFIIIRTDMDMHAIIDISHIRTYIPCYIYVQILAPYLMSIDPLITLDLW